MVSFSRLSNAHVIFATNHAGISEPWGTTTATIQAQQASVLLIGGEKPASPWLLVKSAGTEDVIVQELNNESDLVTIAPVHSESESFVRVDHQRRRFHLHFETAEAFYCFLLSCHHVGRHDQSWRSAGLSVAVLQNEWHSFKIPCEWPEGAKLFRKFLADDHVSQQTEVSVAPDATGNASLARDDSVEEVAGDGFDVGTAADAVNIHPSSANPPSSPGLLTSPTITTLPDQNIEPTSTTTPSTVGAIDGQYPPFSTLFPSAGAFSAPASDSSGHHPFSTQARASSAQSPLISQVQKRRKHRLRTFRARKPQDQLDTIA
ncbi:hypothetical protein BJ138DRAFT_1116076 [Hygrophoropsis aurantiaca]|uniref:Uncharacterized protein n=1 Tax=Hygrophoropsis aurantiaca TaxID=72124 RepID=A0ACB8A424_9AGAM|nr:hypothetical protein BJ138DRAFT_1116076 [Hygrophoropsis aurantiaca]